MPDPEVYARIGEVCRRIANGRRLARLLGLAAREHGLSEAEFRLLWMLSEASVRRRDAKLDQKVLSTELGISTAQVSALVEKLRGRQIIDPVVDEVDRRRQLWRLTDNGRRFFAAVIAEVNSISGDWTLLEPASTSLRSSLEDAA